MNWSRTEVWLTVVLEHDGSSEDCQFLELENLLSASTLTRQDTVDSPDGCSFAETEAGSIGLVVWVPSNSPNFLLRALFALHSTRSCFFHDLLIPAAAWHAIFESSCGTTVEKQVLQESCSAPKHVRTTEYRCDSNRLIAARDGPERIYFVPSIFPAFTA